MINFGTSASAGCVRLTVEDAKWIYENCGSSTKVTFANDSTIGSLGKPSTLKISGSSYNGWDPTDPDSNNPWTDLLNITFNATYYADTYSDLYQAYGYDEDKLLSHWYSCGIYEGRSSSPVFDVSYYLNNNQDLKSAFGNDYYLAYMHFLNYGYNEDRVTTSNFYITFYKNYYSDLNSMSNKDAYLHYISYGRYERKKLLY